MYDTQPIMVGGRDSQVGPAMQISKDAWEARMQQIYDIHVCICNILDLLKPTKIILIR